MWMIATKWAWDRFAPALPWVVLAAVLLGGYWWQARWHYSRGEAAGAAEVQQAWDRDAAERQAALEAYRQAVAAREAEQARIAQEQETALREQVQIADARGRDLARRLRDYEARERARRLSEAAAAAAGGAGAARIPEDSGDARTAVEQALEEHLAACARDAERLSGWQNWWARVATLEQPGG